MLKVSIIIPVYNGKDFIARAIHSCITQTYSNVQIVCVNDGSTDETANELMVFKQADDRVIVVNQENLGVVKARENGVHVATGDYIFFLDADDWLPSYAIDRLVKYANNADMVIGKYITVTDRECISEKIEGLNKVTVYSGVDCLKYIIKSSYDSIWNILIHKELFRNASVDTRIKWSEDFALKVQLSAFAKKIIVAECISYFYYVNTCSVTLSGSLDVFLTWRVAKDSIEIFLKQYGLLPIVSKEWALRSITWELKHLFIGISRFNYTKSPLRVLIWKQLILNPSCGWYIFKNCNFKWKCALLVSIISPICAAQMMAFYSKHCVKSRRD